MKKFGLLWGILALSAASMAQQSEYFLSNPCLSPDGNTVVFSYEGDLWKCPVTGGTAVRITAMDGYETNPRISPDGQWLAFSATQSGNADVYVMPMNGGEIRRLTWHSGNDEVNSWTWDSKSIYFTSNRYSRSGGYLVNINGGTPRRVLGDNYFLYDHNLWQNPVTGDIYFNNTWESSFQVQRKHYKGPFNPDIQSYNLQTREYKKYTDWIGKDFGATIDRKGNVYFISDEGNEEYNLYTFTAGKKTQLTHFNSSIKTPMVNANGGKLVFEKDYQLWLYDVASGQSHKLDISIVRNNILPAEKDYNVAGHITAFDISPDGKKLAFVSRGELFVSDVEGKFVREMDRGNTERVEEVKWMKDSKTLVFSQTWQGFTNWYRMAADLTEAPVALTTDARNNRSLVLNKDRSMGVYLSGRDEVRLLDLKTWKSKTLLKDEIWGIESSDPGFSPNSEYVVYTAYRNFEQDIFLYNLRTQVSMNLTRTGITETRPIWSPDGKYIYFTSQRLKPAYPFGLNDAHVYRLPLEKLDEPFRNPRYNALFESEKKDSASGKLSGNGKAPSAAKDSGSIPIDPEQIMDRIQQVGPSFGTQYLLQLLQKGDKTIVLSVCNQDGGKYSIWKTTLQPFEEPKNEKIAGTEGGGADLEMSGDKYFLLQKGSLVKLNLDGNKTEPIKLSFTFRRNLASEFRQIFEQAWAQMDENYYDEHFHGVNWNGMKEYYGRFLPYLNNRADFRILLNDMLGELNSSHQGFSSSGPDESLPLSARTMETGIVFDNDQPFTVDRILRRSPADHSEIDIKPGDKLVKVNDQVVKPGSNRNFYFTQPSIDEELRLEFERNGKTHQVLLHTEPGLSGNFYDEWIDRNKDRVEKEGGGKIAYACMKNMGQEELERFLTEMTRELPGKEALILDLRYNTGGNVHDEVLQFLSQRSYLQWKYRQGSFTKQPNFAPSDHPIILLVNEQSLSDAEMTTQGFKALKLGKIIGNETYHWIIFTSGVGLVDGSFLRLPAWGCYTLEGKDLEHTGVEPDIRVINTFKDKVEGRDPQLERAIGEIKKEWKK